MPGLAPADQLQAIHRALKGTRGAVVNVMQVDRVAHELTYSGVGNISMKILSYPLSKGCYSYNGIVGHIMPTVLKNHVFPWQVTDMFILHSDGITGRWDLQKYPGILHHHPLLLCAALYKDHQRGTDDATIIVGKVTKDVRQWIA
jgi:serine/threonine protein phosphatase PrpC